MMHGSELLTAVQNEEHQHLEMKRLAVVFGVGKALSC